MTEHDPQSTNGVITLLLLWLFPEKDSSWFYQSIWRHFLAKIIDCLMGQAVLEGPGCCLQSSDLFTLIQPSLSRKEPLGFAVSTAPCCLFFCSAHSLLNRSERRSRGDSVNSHQVLSHSIKKDGSFSSVVGLAAPAGKCDSNASRECPQCPSQPLNSLPSNPNHTISMLLMQKSRKILLVMDRGVFPAALKNWRRTEISPIGTYL